MKPSGQVAAVPADQAHDLVVAASRGLTHHARIYRSVSSHPVFGKYETMTAPANHLGLELFSRARMAGKPTGTYRMNRIPPDDRHPQPRCRASAHRWSGGPKARPLGLGLRLAEKSPEIAKQPGKHVDPRSSATTLPRLRRCRAVSFNVIYKPKPRTSVRRQRRAPKGLLSSRSAALCCHPSDLASPFTIAQVRPHPTSPPTIEIP